MVAGAIYKQDWDAKKMHPTMPGILGLVLYIFMIDAHYTDTHVRGSSDTILSGLKGGLYCLYMVWHDCPHEILHVPDGFLMVVLTSVADA